MSAQLERAKRTVDIVFGKTNLSSWDHVAAILGLPRTSIKNWVADYLNQGDVPADAIGRIHFVVELMKRGEHFTDNQYKKLLAQRDHIDGTVTGLDESKTRKARLEADRAEMELQKMKRELIPVEDVLAITTGPIADIVNRLESLLPRLQRIMPEMSAAASEAVEREIATMRNEIASIQMEKLE